VAFATILHFQTLATYQATTWLVVTRPAAGHPLSVLSQAFHQSKLLFPVIKAIKIKSILPPLPFVFILSLAVSFDLDLKLNKAFESISRLLRAH